MSRYIVFDIMGQKMGPDEAERSINSELFDLLGEINLALYDYRFLAEKFSGNTGIIKCNSKGLNPIRAALCLIKRLDGKESVVAVKGVSGTIKTASRKFLNTTF